MPAERVHTLFYEEISTKMWILPIDDLFMVGKSAASKLKDMGIKTIGDLARYDKNKLIKKFKSHGKLMWEYANGIDNSEVDYKPYDTKSISSSTVLPYNYNNKLEIYKVIKELSSLVGMKLRKKKKYAYSINIWIKYSNFIKESKQISMDNCVNNDKDIYNIAVSLFDKLWDKDTYIRGLCVGVSNLSDCNDKQLSLFNSNDSNVYKNDDKLQDAMDKIRGKYGNNIITYADMLNKNKE